MSQQRFLSPRYWPTWIGILLLNLWARLPWSLQVHIARVLSAAMKMVARRRRGIVEVNLRLCYPDWTEATRQQKVREVLFNNTLGLVEAANAYARPPEHYRSRLQVTGQEVLEQAHAQGRGVLLLGAHYSHLDLGGALTALVCDPFAIYRPNNNPLMDKYIRQGRDSFLKGSIERSDIRGIVRQLKKNQIVWYPPDQDYGRKHSVYAPFFGVNAATITATSRLVKFNQTPVVMMACRRDGLSERYQLSFYPAPEGFPSGDDVTDAGLINQALEACIRQEPTQYMWTHRRFKTQPDGRAKLYQ